MIGGGGRKFKARPNILGGNGTIFLASIVFFIMVEYFCLSSKIKSEIIKAKHPT